MTETSIARSISEIQARAARAGVTLGRGANERAIAALEKVLGQALPDDVRAFFRVHDGAFGDAAVQGRSLLSLKAIESQWKIWKGLFDRGAFGPNDHGEPGRGVQKAWWVPSWIPMTHDGAGNHHVLDLAPATSGTRGQIVELWHDRPSRRVVGSSFVDWLANARWGDAEAAVARESEREVRPPRSRSRKVDQTASKKPPTSKATASSKTSGRAAKLRRFEMEQKFWAIRLQGTALTVEFGASAPRGGRP